MKFKGYLNYHVRVFTIMSFYFSYKTLSSLNTIKIFRRFQRLLIPYIIWPIIVYFLNKNVISKYIEVKIYTFEQVKQQLLVGNAIIHPFWYTWNLIFITILFILIIFLFRNCHKFIFILLSITAYIYQYNGKNMRYFSRFKKNADMFTYGRVLELIPCSVTGFIIGSYDLMNYFKKFKIRTILVCIYFFYFLKNYNLFVSNFGFSYAGLKDYLDSNCIFFLFAMFPSDKIKNKIIIKVIKLITGHTAGVYYLHVVIYKYLTPFFISIQNKTLTGSIIIYLGCYLVCFIGNLIFGKTILRYLFE